jgi:hypothetical protein
MADRQIIFSAPMIRALQDGRKTQTRRIITPGNSLFNGGRWSALHKRQEWDWEGAWVDGGPSPMGNPGPYLKLPWQAGDDDFEGSVHRIYPVIQPGDRLWVKEAVAWVSGWGWRYRADNDDLSEKREQGEVGRWRSPIHMPRWASRLTLTVTDVRVQGVQEIAEADAVAEGVNPCLEGNQCPDGRHGGCCAMYDPNAAFYVLWNSLHGPDAWNANPWVWVKTFDVHLGNIDSIGGGNA